MRIDLHTHSRVSDGTQSPTELVAAGKAAGLDVMAITDHDTADSWDEAARAAEQVGLTLIRGMEISCRHGWRGVHLLAYLPDPTYPPLAEELRLILDGRQARVPGMLAKLEAHGMPLTLADVTAQAADAAAIGRPHIADALVAAGYIRNRDQAFDELLGAGCPGYVERYAAPLTRVLDAVTGAGGVAVIAHPWGRRREPGPLDAAGLAALKELGLAGIEVDHQDHDAATREELRGIARELDLIVTGSSDHHGIGKVNHDLGCNTTEAAELERLLARVTSGLEVICGPATGPSA